MGAPRRRHQELPDRRGRLRAEGRSSSPRPGPRTPPTSWPRSTSAAPSAPPTASDSVKQMIDRVVNRYHEEGLERGYFEDDDEASDVQGRADPPARDPEGSLQLAGVVQRRLAPQGPGAVLRVLHPLGRGRDEVDPQLVRRRGNDLQGRLRLRHQPVDDPLLEGASEVRWNRVGSGLVHARRRRFRRNDQVGWRHTACRQDGRAQRRPPGRQGLHLVQGARGAEGTGSRARPASTWTSTARTSHSIQYQNANNSVRVTDEFMQAALDDKDWDLKAVTTARPIETVKASELLREISEAAWECADPGIQYDTTINDWHTCPNTDRINASNPCSEYVHVDNSRLQPGVAQPHEVRRRQTTASTSRRTSTRSRSCSSRRRSRSASPATRPRRSRENSHRFRQLGQGYANLGALLMSQGLAYDSDEGRAWAGSDHRDHDGSLLRHLGQDRRSGSGRSRSTPRTRADAPGHEQAPRRRLRDPRGPGSRTSWSTPLARSWDEALALGESTVTATRRRRCSLRPARSA